MESRLPSAKISGRQSPTSVFDFAEPGCDAIDIGVVSEQQPEMFEFLQHSDLNPFTIASVRRECDADGEIDCDISLTSDDNSLPPPILLPTGAGTYDSALNGDGFFDAPPSTGDSSIAALYKMNELVRTGRSRVEVYQEVCQVGGKVFDYGSDGVPDGQLCGHMDGGSMVNTCHCSALFWGRIHPFKNGERPILQVADKFEHHAQGWGYIRVPSDTTYGYTEVRCLYTPTLEAVILSPDYSGKFLHCRGYVSVSNFDGQGCGVTLRHCQRSSQDIHFPLTQVRGLLFTGPLLLPPTDPSPCHNKLHVERVELDDATAPTDNTRQPCACSHAADDNHHCPEHVCLPCGASSWSPVPDHVSRTCPCANSDGINHGADDATRPSHASAPLEPSLAQTYSNVLWHERLGFQSDVAVDNLDCACNSTEAAACMPTATPDVLRPVSSPPATGEGSSVKCASDPLLSVPPMHSADAVDDKERAKQRRRDERKRNRPRRPLPTRLDEHVHDDPDHTYVIRHVTRDQQRLLWHVRFAHMHSRRVAEMHRHAIGVPKVAMATDLDTCPVCAAAKIKKAARGKEDSRHATVCGQGISIDMGFMVQKSSADSKRVERLKGVNGETSYCLITDHKSGRL